jgi:hypothetical protein
MKKDEVITRYGEAAYEKMLEQGRQWHRNNPEKKERESNRKNGREQNRRGGKFYEKYLEYNRTGLRGERCKIRAKHRGMWREYKQIIAPESQIHHAWRPGTSEYDGIALVETDKHMHGIIKVIIILGGEITLLTEKEIRERNQNTQPFGHNNQSSSLASGSSG